MKLYNRNKKHHIRTSKKGTPESQKEDVFILPTEKQRKENIKNYKEKKQKKKKNKTFLLKTK